MGSPADVYVFFNFRSPYCYLATKSMFSIFDEFHANLIWRPLGGWSGRSAPDRAQVKMPLVRQDVKRWCRKLGIPFNPPPRETMPTRAGAVSLVAEERGLLQPYIVETMRIEWAEGRNIGETDVLREVARRIGLDEDDAIAAADDPIRHKILEKNAEEAAAKGSIGVPTFVIGDQIFWGNDRIEFVKDHLREMALRRL